jgi:aminopeptidase N
MALHITVPESLVVASNGVLRGVEAAEGARTYHWFVPSPINSYGVSLNIASYERLDTTYTSITSEVVPVSFWVLPESADDGQRLVPQILDHLAFYERHLGPYPFRQQKYGVAHTPFLGMEHQTIIAYGSSFRDAPYGYDWLHHHELGHEWFGNLVTAADWKDFWIHEGFTTYMQALYVEERFGPERYRQEMQRYRRHLVNRKPLAPEATRTTAQMYFADAAQQTPDNDAYNKGAWVLHTLRYLIGEGAFFSFLRRMTYPDPALEQGTPPFRLVSSDDVIRTAEAAAGQELDWFFDSYLHQPELPHLRVEREADRVQLSWEVSGGQPFLLPVPVEVDGKIQHVEMQGGRATVQVPPEAVVKLDPEGWLLRTETSEP